MTNRATHIAEKTRPEAQAPAASASHVTDLRAASAALKPSTPRTRGDRSVFAKLAAVLDDRIHFHDHHARSVSVRARGWRDFPPPEARDLAHAVAVTSKRFFNEHPLADLAVVSLAHLIVLLAWEIATAPLRLFSAIKETEPIVAPPTFVIPAKAGIQKRNPALTLLAAVAPAEPAPKPAQKRPSTTVTERFAPLLSLFSPAVLRRPALAFAMVAAAFIIPLGAYGTLGDLQQDKASVIAIGKRAAAHMQNAAASSATGDFASAKTSFDEATADFDRAKSELGILANVLNAAGTILPGSRIGSVGPLMNAGREISSAGALLAAGAGAVSDEGTPIRRIAVAKDQLDAAIPHLERAAREIAKVSPEAVPEEYRAYIALAREKMPKGLEAAKNVSTASDVLLTLLGVGGPKRYLVVFQNNSELRPTGGFMGSFALIDVKNGKIVKMEVPGGGTYDVKGQLAAKIRSPQPLHLINPRWEFQDANWDPDYPTSAKRIAWFYEQAGGPTVDGVIAINATFMEKLLAVTGPIDMPEYGKTIDAQNFFYETQKQVEVDYDKTENKPKAFIGDLAPKMIERLIGADTATLMKLAPVAQTGLAAKEILLWTRDTETASKLASLGWTGEMKATGGDYLAIIHANIAGQKTDLKMQDDVRHDAKILPDGSAVVTLSITRSHTGQKGALFSGVRNVNYMRVYVPEGSVLVEATGFTPPDPKLFKVSDPSDGADAEIESQERGIRIDRRSGTAIGSEHGKTVFGNWVQTDPGESSAVTLVYQLPAGTYPIQRADTKAKALHGAVADEAPDRLNASLVVQKQSGANPAKFVTSIDLPRGYVPVQQDPERIRDDRDRWTTEAIIDRDLFFGSIAESR